MRLLFNCWHLSADFESWSVYSDAVVVVLQEWMVQLLDTKVEGFNSSGQSTRVESWPSAINRVGSLAVPASIAPAPIHPISHPNRMLVTDSALLAASTTPAASASAVWKMTDLPVSTGTSSLPLSAHPHHHPHHIHPVGASGKIRIKFFFFYFNRISSSLTLAKKKTWFFFGGGVI